MLGTSKGPSASVVQACANFSTGIASPVSADWLMNRSLVSSSRRSAGIMSPADSRTMSPGTSVSIGISGAAGASGLGRTVIGSAVTARRSTTAPADKGEIDESTSTYDKEKLRERLSPGSRGGAVIRVCYAVYNGNEGQGRGLRPHHRRDQGCSRPGRCATCALGLRMPIRWLAPLLLTEAMMTEVPELAT